MLEFRYRPEVDGLRAVAVVLVLLFHTNLGFSGGFVGVDVFFVISGFLITGLILKEQKSGKFSLSNFWVRRIRRIIPASTVMVMITLLAGGFLLLPSDYEELGKSMVAQQLMLSNVFFWRNTGYFAGPADLKPLLHTWSLAVEEQYYLGYPFLLMFLGRVRNRTSVYVLGIITIASFALSEWGVHHHADATFFLLPTRAWELVIGGLICFVPVPTKLSKGQAEVLSSLAVGGILGAGWFYDSSTPFPGLAALLPCGATALLIYTNSLHLTMVGRLLARKSVIFVGLISYSLYLWHWPVLAFTKYWVGEELTATIGISALVVSFGFAYLSWRFVEKPMRRANSLQVSRVAVFKIAFTVACVCLLLSATVVVTKGGRFRFSRDLLAFDQGEHGNVSAEYGGSVGDAKSGTLPVVGASNPTADHLDFIVWGDSHARQLGQLSEKMGEKYGLSGIVASMSATPPLLGNGETDDAKREWNKTIIETILSRNIPNVILVGRWEALFRKKSPGDDMSRGRALLETIRVLRTNDINVWLLRQIPKQIKAPGPSMFLAHWWGLNLPRGISIEQYNESLAEFDRTVAPLLGMGVNLLDPTPFCFDTQGYSLLGDTGGGFYWDDDHLSGYGADVLLTPLLEAVFAKIAGESSNRHVLLKRWNE